MPIVGQTSQKTQGKSQQIAETPEASCFLCPILRGTLSVWIYKTLNLYGFQRFLGKFIGSVINSCMPNTKKSSGNLPIARISEDLTIVTEANGITRLPLTAPAHLRREYSCSQRRSGQNHPKFEVLVKQLARGAHRHFPYL